MNLVARSVLWSLLLLLASRCGAEDVRLQFRKEVRLPAVEEEWFAVELDSEVYAATLPSLADLRLLDAQRRAVPYQLHRAQATERQTVTRTWTADNPTLRPLAEGGLEIVVQLDDDAPQPDHLRLVTPLKNFEQRVQVFTSADGQQWRALTEEVLIFDYSRYMDVRRDRIALPPGGDRRFRLVVERPTSEQESQLLELTRQLQGGEVTGQTERVEIERRPFRVSRVEFSLDVETRQATGPRTTSYPVADVQTVELADEQQTRLEIATAGQPLTSFRLQTSDRNFSRRAVVEVERPVGGTTEWRAIGSATLTRIDLKSLQQEQLEIAFPETRAARYRVVIENRDSRPLSIAAVEARGPVYELMFLVERPPTAADAQDEPLGYQLAYGGEAPPPNYDTAAIAALLSSSHAPARATLGPEREAAADEVAPRAFRWSDLLNSKPLLFSVILLLVVGLGWGLYQAARRVEHLPHE